MHQAGVFLPFDAQCAIVSSSFAFAHLSPSRLYLFPLPVAGPRRCGPVQVGVHASPRTRDACGCCANSRMFESSACFARPEHRNGSCGELRREILRRSRKEVAEAPCLKCSSNLFVFQSAWIILGELFSSSFCRNPAGTWLVLAEVTLKPNCGRGALFSELATMLTKRIEGCGKLHHHGGLPTDAIWAILARIMQFRGKTHDKRRRHATSWGERWNRVRVNHRSSCH